MPTTLRYHTHIYVGPGSQLSASVVGRRVRIGANVTVRDSHIWNDVVIEDGAVCVCVYAKGSVWSASIRGCDFGSSARIWVSRR